MSTAPTDSNDHESCLPRVLCVDDETRVLEGLSRKLRRHFDVSVASSGALGLEKAGENCFSVVVSDLRMPEMNGIEFLARMREVAPDTTRMLLTGNADLDAAIAAVNEGHLFRFLSKPCPTETLVSAISSGVEIHRLRTAERVLLQQTLHGSVRMLTEVLAIASPASFGHTVRLMNRVSSVAKALEIADVWMIELAVMLSQVAYITVPAETLERHQSGSPLSSAEQEVMDRLPEISAALLNEIPRLEEVHDMLRLERIDFTEASGREHHAGALILRAVRDLDLLQKRGLALDEALDVLESRQGVYDPEILSLLRQDESAEAGKVQFRKLSASGLRAGMVLMDPVEAADGRLIVASGQEVSASLIARLRNFAESVGLREPIRVRL